MAAFHLIIYGRFWVITEAHAEKWKGSSPSRCFGPGRNRLRLNLANARCKRGFQLRKALQHILASLPQSCGCILSHHGRVSAFPEKRSLPTQGQDFATSHTNGLAFAHSSRACVNNPASALRWPMPSMETTTAFALSSYQWVYPTRLSEIVWRRSVPSGEKDISVL